MCDSGCVSVVLRGVAGRGGGEGGGICCRLYRDNHTISIFKPINLLFVRLANRWGPRGGILRTDREQVNKITRPLLHVKPVLMCWTIGRETVTIRQKKCTCCVLYPVGDGRSFLLFRACFFPPHSRLDKKNKCRCSRRCARC